MDGNGKGKRAANRYLLFDYFSLVTLVPNSKRLLILPVQKHVLLGPAQAGLGWSYLAQAGLALPQLAWASPGQKAGLAQHGLGRPGPAEAGKVQFSLAIHWPGPAQASRGLARLVW